MQRVVSHHRKPIAIVGFPSLSGLPSAIGVLVSADQGCVLVVFDALNGAVAFCRHVDSLDVAGGVGAREASSLPSPAREKPTFSSF